MLRVTALIDCPDYYNYYFLRNYTVLQETASQMWHQYKTMIPNVISAASSLQLVLILANKNLYEVKVLMLFDFAQWRLTAVKLPRKLIIICYFKYFQLLILGGTCRLISEIESGDRFVKRTRVVPFNVQQKAPHLLRVQQANRGPNPGPNPWQPSTATATTTATATATATAAATAAASSSKAKRGNATDDSEDGSRRNTARKKWAKVDPKYNPVFSLLD